MERETLNSKAGFRIGRLLWHTTLVCGLALGLWRCVSPVEVEPTYKLCQNTHGECDEGFVCVLNACVRRSIEAVHPEPLPEPQFFEVPTTVKDGGEVSLPEKVCPEGAPECELCLEKKDCGVGRICSAEGICKVGCTDNNDCTDAASPVCDMTDNQCKECVTSENCVLKKPGTVCRNTTCQACDTDDTCKTVYGDGNLCIDGACKKAECRQNSDCPTGHPTCGDECFCRANICQPCNSDSECGSGKLCILDKCGQENCFKCIQGDCRNDGNCLGGKVCRNNVCSGCQSNADCQSGQVCDTQTSICTVGQCTMRSECPNGLLCVGGKCVGCSQDNQCSAGELCIDTLCQNADCRERKDCSSGQTCFNYRCGPCLQDSDCSTGELCLSGSCKVAECRLRSNCVGPDSGKLCKNNICSPCVSKSECESTEICLSGKCVAGNCVDTLTDCGSVRQICQGNQCRACNKKSDCAPYQGDCVSGKCVVVVETNNGAYIWSDGKIGLDCADYRFPTDTDAYQPATQSGLYRIKPASVSTPFVVHCEMEYAGGGWTLVLKADGNSSIFSYGSSLWTNNTVHPSSNVSRDRARTEAKLESFATVPVQEVLLQMQQSQNDPVRSGIAHIRGNSFMDVMKKPNNTGLDQAYGLPNWRSMVANSSMQRTCLREGVNLLASNGNVRGVRIGFIANNDASSLYCPSNADSAIGFGIETNGISSGTTVGNVSRDRPDNGNQNHKVFGYIYVRELRSRLNLQLDSAAFTLPGGKAAASCLEYHMPPAASGVDGLYWIQPPGLTQRMKTYCRMSFQGGGWSLAMKIDGTKTTFSYDKGIWTDTNPLNTDKVDFTNDAEAKLGNFWTQPFSQVALSFRISSSGVYTIIASKKANSLRAIFQNSARQPFDYSLGRYAWKWTMPIASLQDRCDLEGFNVRTSDTNAARARIGITANEDSQCDALHDSRIGVGTASNYCGQDNDNSAGNEARCGGDEGDKSTKAFVYVQVR
ncbi:MAG: hypothetical protein H6728_10110 [Myxococcales bacterium]|nr:hypothetical protein [Myxococcales bacterium]MCB9643416.1 hypothetical protein [Myxococcales bacterium]